MNDQTRAHLRKLWIRVSVILIVAFGGIYLLSLLSEDTSVGEETKANCDPPQFLCSRSALESWLDVSLPESARGVEYASDDTQGPVLWLRFDAPVDDVTAFLEVVRISGTAGLEFEMSSIPEPAPGQLGWWQPQSAQTRADLGSDVRPARFIRVQMDQDDSDRWVVYLTGLDTSTSEEG